MPTPGWRPLWELGKSRKPNRFNCLLRPWGPEGPSENITTFWKYFLHRYDEHGFVYRPDAPTDVLAKIKELIFKVMRTGGSEIKKGGTPGNRARVDPCKWIHSEGANKSPSGF